MLRLDGAVFYSHNIDTIEKFYTALGFSVEFRDHDAYISFILPDGGRLGVKRAVDEREHPGHQTIHLEVDNLPRYRKLADELGAPIYKDTRDYPGGGTYFDILDPDRNKLTFVQPNTL